ncbi:glycoside hydrolase family 38 C-terminal domain-containing protein [Herbiconiux sp. L3-i23]|uniref:alpha-mannosidase n=1 Tax=Herbiconiux sp. L3-i23 TaxID=2905871 RepID=UPI0020620C2D|nr:glycoside hydrolase family 38 C-terminal domain-containing protein [Herbiconiux sp. L3-i23]BDI22670.1 putative glycosyl hydrolase [Herbiconiux sp. L3-i23]
MGFASWLIGLPAAQPEEYRRLTRIRSRVYTRVRSLDAEILRSPEPIPFDRLDRTAFSPIRPNTAWGGPFDCAWLHLTGLVPPGPDDLVLLLGIRGEGLVHGAAGELLDSVSTVFQQGDLPHSGGKYRPVEVDLSSGAVDVYADVTYNGFILYEVGKAVYHGAHLATRDDDAYRLYYDYLALVVLAGATEDAALERTLRRALRDAYSLFRRRDVRGARAVLAVPLAARSESEFTYDAVGHGHLDMAWLWPVRETKRKAARTYVRALNAIDRRDDYVYGTSQPQQLWWMRERHPALFERIRGAVAAGRMEIQGSFWVEPDTNLPSGESLVRQAVVGRRFLQDEFALTDEQLRLCWLPDTFGYSGNLPQILRGAGMDWFQTIKLAWNKVNDFPHRTFHWQGIDGSSVLVHMPPEGDYNSRASADNLLTGLARYPERALQSALLVYGSGDGGGGPGEIHHELLDREADLRGLPRVRRSSASEFFGRLEQKPIEHTHVGELYLETHQGTYTTQGAIKRHNRIVERMLHDAEALAVIVGDDSRETLAEHWRAVLLNQFHDIIPGSSIARVNREAIDDYERVEAALADYTFALADRLPDRDSAPTALNLTSFPRREHVSVGGEWFVADVGPYAAAALRPAERSDALRADGDTLSNSALTLRFAPDGSIGSCLDADGVEHAGEGLNRLVTHDDPYVWPFNAWDIDPRYLDTPARVLTASEVENSVDDVTAVRRQVYRTRTSTIVQRVVLEAGSDLVRFETEVEWHEKHTMLRAEFRPLAYGDTVRCEIQFGHIERATTERDSVEKAQFEVCAHRWVATESDSRGFALLNDGKYGHRVKNGLISLNLLRAPTFPDKTADRGHHRFSYAVRPFEAGDLTPVIAAGYRLGAPLQVLTGGSVPSVASVDDPAVVIETLKKAEDGGGVVLRLYESLGRPVTTALRVSLPHGSAYETDLLERRLGPADLDRLAFRPFEIKTILLEDDRS